MNEILIKYNALDDFLQKQVMDFIDYLLVVRNSTKALNMSSYKRKILNVSTWSEDDLKIFGENTKSLGGWKITEF